MLVCSGAFSEYCFRYMLTSMYQFNVCNVLCGSIFACLLNDFISSFLSLEKF